VPFIAFESVVKTRNHPLRAAVVLHAYGFQPSYIVIGALLLRPIPLAFGRLGLGALLRPTGRAARRCNLHGQIRTRPGPGCVLAALSTPRQRFRTTRRVLPVCSGMTRLPSTCARPESFRRKRALGLACLLPFSHGEAKGRHDELCTPSPEPGRPPAQRAGATPRQCGAGFWASQSGSRQ
jgi:hypothetical protein